MVAHVDNSDGIQCEDHRLKVSVCLSDCVYTLFPHEPNVVQPLNHCSRRVPYRTQLVKLVTWAGVFYEGPYVPFSLCASLF